MHKKFDHKIIEQKWQSTWKQNGIYNAGERDQNKEKEYVLVELPYPSGNLHIGHWYAFAVPDIYVRYRRMQGKQVVYPMGFDAFGLPAENAAIKRNINPREWTESNIEYMRAQLESMGNAFSWDKTTSTIDPTYYKWTQWMFGEFFKNGIAYRGTGTVNWCPGCHTVIANEQVLADGTCERSGDVIEKKTMPQWSLRITDYADELIDDLDNLDWPEHIKEAQRQWIGRSKGAEIDFELSIGERVTVFTTRPDTLFGATYLVLAPEHTLVQQYKGSVANWSEVETYVQTAKQKDDIERGDNTKEKTGVKLEGITATNPANGEEIPVYIADYVLGGYGTGAIMAVPAHDERDNAFARKFELPIKSVIAPSKILYAGALLESKQRPGSYIIQYRSSEFKTFAGQFTFFGGKVDGDETPEDCIIREIKEELELTLTKEDLRETYTFIGEPDTQMMTAIVRSVDEQSLVCHEGEIAVLTLDEILSDPRVSKAVREYVQNHLTNKNVVDSTYGEVFCSGEFDGMSSEEAKIAITEKVGGRMTNTYRLRDWSIGRQRYWGVPIPIVYDPEGKAHVVPKEHLPWRLPEDVDFTPTGEPPLAKSQELKERTERIFGAGWTPEVETMDTFVDSSWYFLRYMDNANDDEFASLQTQKDWLPIDMYFGGAEHTTMHLLYSRFWQKALYRLGLVQHAEPYRRRANHGMILGPDGNKMSKSKGNVIDPDEQVQLVGADTVKMYLAFMGPYENSSYPWDPGGVAGLRRFLERANGLDSHITENEQKEVTSLLHKTIRKVSTDIEQFKFNTAVSAMMIFVNLAEKHGLCAHSYETFLKLLAPFAPHLTEELWGAAGHASTIHYEVFPEADSALATDDTVIIGVQINGKVRGTITLAIDATEAEAMEAAKNEPTLSKRFEGATISKVIYVPGRILNILMQQ